jgi:hypothetical protein
MYLRPYADDRDIGAYSRALLLLGDTGKTYPEQSLHILGRSPRDIRLLVAVYPP